MSDDPLTGRSASMGQSPYYPPSVFSFYSPAYVIPNLRWFGPEFQILNGSTALNRANFVESVIQGYLGPHLTFDITPWKQLAGNTNNLIQALNMDFFAGQMTTSQEHIIATAVAAAGNPTTAAQIGLFLAATSADFKSLNRTHMRTDRRLFLRTP